jgi:predicted RNA-binding protein YlqC (UPF0109 family)
VNHENKGNVIGEQGRRIPERLTIIQGVSKRALQL